MFVRSQAGIQCRMRVAAGAKLIGETGLLYCFCNARLEGAQPVRLFLGPPRNRPALERRRLDNFKKCL
jgi:hypothetical protein